MQLQNRNLLSGNRALYLSWAAFICFFAYEGIEKYGLLLSYLKISNGLILVISFFLTRLAFRAIRFRFRFSWNSKQSVFYAILELIIALTIFMSVFFCLSLVSDKLVLLATNLPHDVLWPCSAINIDPDIEKIAKKLHKLRDIDSFDCD